MTPSEATGRELQSSPLSGRRVVVTRAASDVSKLGGRLEEAGAEVIELPTIELGPPESWEPLDDAIRRLSEGLYSWVVFTSGNAVKSFFERLDVGGRDASAFGPTKVAAVGSATANLLRERRIRADFVPHSFTAQALAEELGHGAGAILVPRAADAPRDLLVALESRGWLPHDVPAYRTVPARGDSAAAHAVRAGRFDVVTFASGSAVKGFVGLVGDPADVGLSPSDPPSRLVACIGPVTAGVAAAEGFRVDVCARRHTIDGLVTALVEHVRRDATMAP